ncbi:P-loop ATPase, Sll1717 family [Geothrix sp. PMB-07]|uniref:P-loop ATPase, Sll1717 family n=1 Tax=Geothrix sp. PMB-07 TaxID=3068640 RepID=UPI00274258FE|nr:hypothetical protein [Geothrix sp. PMB-07]WLT30792.1 hypothetical protein Q9293_13810 [Geothrix sp. PMB-07]
MPIQPANGHLKGFFAYPSFPRDLGLTIKASIDELRKYTSNPEIESWEEMDIYGKFIAKNVREDISNSDFFIADITETNLNVTFEIGYALGLGKKILLTKNNSIRETHKIESLGLFDTIGYKTYQNSKELFQWIRSVKDLEPTVNASQIPKTDSPIYLIEPKYKTDQIIHTISRIKKTGLKFRSFDPQERARLSAYEAIEEVSKSFGVFLYFISESQDDYIFHNQRVAFLAGLSEGLGKELMVLQFDDIQIPIDLRDSVFSVRHPRDIEDKIHEFASKVTELLQQKKPYIFTKSANPLSKIHLGSSSAENELTELKNYYLETDEFKRTKRGEVRIVVGRKGSGKTAIFAQTKEHAKKSTKNLVLDLKPDGYKLLKFKESILDLLKTGTLEHTLMAFWEYLLLLEICHKIIETDRTSHLRNPDLFDSYNQILNLYNADNYDSDGDFSERLSHLLERIRSDYMAKFPGTSERELSNAEVTGLIYNHDVKNLRLQVEMYLKNKEEVWILFDNLDKGWPSHGVQPEDITIIKTLIEALRKLERQLQRHSIDTHSVIFLRNDVYELLISETSDRGKEAKAIIDWKDPELLKELIRRRLLNNDEFSTLHDQPFLHLWSQIFSPLYRGEETSNYLIERSLLRPRYLLDLINKCKGIAVNLNHPKITESDIEKGLYDYSSELVTHINLEIQDVHPSSENILYTLIESNAKTSIYNIEQSLLSYQIDLAKIPEIIDILLWHAVLGISSNPDEIKYIYNFNYDFILMKAFMKKKQGEISCIINPAFWPALAIKNNL